LVKFVSVDKVKPGVTLARDVYGVDTFTGRIVMLKANQVLTTAHITKLLGLDLQGIYVHDNKSIMSTLIATSEKKEVISNIKELYKIAGKATESIYVGNIENTNDVLEKLIDTITDLESFYLTVDDLRLYDDNTYNHALGTTILAIAIGKHLRVTREDLTDLALSALLHDIGMVQIPISITQKPARLTDEEFDIIKLHPAQGTEALKDNERVSERVLTGILSHHEHYDGNGYPNRPKGKQIPFFGRIIACADVYDALTSQRPHRGAFSAHEAIEYVMGNAERQFDSGVVKAFLKCVSPYPVGNCVKLSNGELAVVVTQNPENPLRPSIFLMDNPSKIIDLYSDKNYLNVVISEVVEEVVES